MGGSSYENNRDKSVWLFRTFSSLAFCVNFTARKVLR